jgi:sec-independent protein translocase protein TatA
MLNLTLLGIGMPGPMELAIIFGIILVLFGGARLPSLMRNIGRSTVEFRRGMHEDDGSGGGGEQKPE